MDTEIDSRPPSLACRTVADTVKQIECPVYYAILVGNDYDSDKPLNSCVRDVRAISKCLRERGLTNLNIDLLASVGPEAAAALQEEVSEEPEMPATLNNLVSVLAKTRSKAKGGDRVYIHFSGHATETEPRRLKRLRRDIAMVLHDEENERKYFRGWQLAKVMRDLTKNGVHVDLVLDCCRSGSILRGDNANDLAEARFLEYQEDVDLASCPSDYELAEEEAWQRSVDSGDIRGASGTCVRIVQYERCNSLLTRARMSDLARGS